MWENYPFKRKCLHLFLDLIRDIQRSVVIILAVVNKISSKSLIIPEVIISNNFIGIFTNSFAWRNRCLIIFEIILFVFQNWIFDCNCVCNTCTWLFLFWWCVHTVILVSAIYIWQNFLHLLRFHDTMTNTMIYFASLISKWFLEDAQ